MKPVLQALLLADHVYQDKGSGKHVVAGIFHTLYFKRKEVVEAEAHEGKVQLPTQVGSPYAYISLTDVRGEQSFKLRYVDLELDAVLFEYKFGVNVDDPLKIVDVSLPLPPLPTGKAGVFSLELLWSDDEPLGAYRLIVKEMDKTEPQNGNS